MESLDLLQNIVKSNKLAKGFQRGHWGESIVPYVFEIWIKEKAYTLKYNFFRNNWKHFIFI